LATQSSLRGVGEIAAIVTSDAAMHAAHGNAPRQRALNIRARGTARAGFNLMAVDWLVQPFRPGSSVQAEQCCINFGDVVARVRKFRRANTDSRTKLRVYVPSHATEAERREVVTLGVEAV
jgi:hypothetical protein